MMPPYGNTARLLPACGNHVFVMAGPMAWQMAGEKQMALRPANPTKAPVLVLPLDRPAAAFEWPVSGMDVTVLDSGAGDETLDGLGRALVQAGASLVVIVPELGAHRPTIYRPSKERRHAA